MTATVSTASAVVTRMSRSATGQLLAPGHHEWIIVAVSGSQVLGDHHGRDRLIACQSGGPVACRPVAGGPGGGCDHHFVYLCRHRALVDRDCHGGASSLPREGSHGSQSREPTHSNRAGLAATESDSPRLSSQDVLAGERLFGRLHQTSSGPSATRGRKTPPLIQV